MKEIVLSFIYKNVDFDTNGLIIPLRFVLLFAVFFSACIFEW